jgi:hypothetical protein
MISTGYSISGAISDLKSQFTVDRAVVVIRKGTHNPAKIEIQPQDTIPTQSYSVFADASGNYNLQNIPQAGYYFVQSFSDFYVPSYFKQSGPSPVFWQQGDSVQINTALTNKNISMKRDSSIGGGIINGIVNTGTIIPDKRIVIYAKSTDYNIPFNYAIPIGGKTFTVNNLPYGSYQLIGQLIGYADATSGTVNITAIDTQVNDIALNFTTTGIHNNPIIPQTVELDQNYPNPFNPNTTIQFYLPRSSYITLKIFNYIGQEIETLVNRNYNEGRYTIYWNAKNLASGVYSYVLNYGGTAYSKKMILLK